MRVAYLDEKGRAVITQLQYAVLIDDNTLQMDEVTVTFPAYVGNELEKYLERKVRLDINARTAYNRLLETGYLDLRPMSITEFKEA